MTIPTLFFQKNISRKKVQHSAVCFFFFCLFQFHCKMITFVAIKFPIHDICICTVFDLCWLKDPTNNLLFYPINSKLSTQFQKFYLMALLIAVGLSRNPSLKESFLPDIYIPPDASF